VESYGASVLVEASVIVGATVLEATVLVKATVLGRASCSEVDPESVDDMDSRNMTSAGRCEKSSSNCKHTFLIVIACDGFFLLHCGRRFFMPCVTDRLAQSIIYGFFLLHLRKAVFYAIAFY
jgi:hypothetical protein